MKRALVTALMLAALRAEAHRPITTAVTWDREIVRIFRDSCVECHSQRGGAFPLQRYEEARAWSRAIREEVLERSMPPWPAARGVGEFANDPSLPPRVIELIVAWVDGGTPRGDTTEPVEAIARIPPARHEPMPGARRVSIGTGATMDRDRTIAGAIPQAAPDTSIEVRAMFVDGTREEIVYIPRFDRRTRRSRTYWLKKPLFVPKGTVVEVVGGRAAVVFSEETRRPASPPSP